MPVYISIYTSIYTSFVLATQTLQSLDELTTAGILHMHMYIIRLYVSVSKHQRVYFEAPVSTCIANKLQFQK